jgi:hypothetical protein
MAYLSSDILNIKYVQMYECNALWHATCCPVAGHLSPDNKWHVTMHCIRSSRPDWGDRICKVYRTKSSCAVHTIFKNCALENLILGFITDSLFWDHRLSHPLHPHITSWFIDKAIEGNLWLHDACESWVDSTVDENTAGTSDFIKMRCMEIWPRSKSGQAVL